MSIIATLTKRWHYSVENPGAGRLVYREGNHEFTFPYYEKDGAVVLVGVPSSQRVHFFFNWYPCRREFSEAARNRILPRIAEHLQSQCGEVRVLERGDPEGGDFEFYPELFEQRGRVADILAAAGYSWFGDFSSIEPLHEEYGLEVCGILNDNAVGPIMEALRREFPHWHHQKVCLQDYGREPGWTVSICMFPSRPCNSGWYDGD
jgi:hypothetical protein